MGISIVSAVTFHIPLFDSLLLFPHLLPLVYATIHGIGRTFAVSRYTNVVDMRSADYGLHVWATAIGASEGG